MKYGLFANFSHLNGDYELPIGTSSLPNHIQFILLFHTYESIFMVYVPGILLHDSIGISLHTFWLRR